MADSLQKVDALLADLPATIAGAGEKGDQLQALITTARGFGLDPVEYVKALLPTDPAALDLVVVELALRLLKCRSDDANQLMIGVDGGHLFSLAEYDHHGNFIADHLQPPEPAAEEAESNEG